MMDLDLSEEERQAMVLALAELALSRPGWDEMLRGIAGKFCSVQLFDEYKKIWSEPPASRASGE